MSLDYTGCSVELRIDGKEVGKGFENPSSDNIDSLKKAARTAFEEFLNSEAFTSLPRELRSTVNIELRYAAHLGMPR